MRSIAKLFFVTLIFVSNIGFTFAQEVICPDLKINLTLASKGSEVEELQRFLISKNFNIPALTERNASYGFFGKETQTAVMEYQKSVNLNPTGFFGPLTRMKIKNSCGEVETETAVTPVIETTMSSITISDVTSTQTKIENEAKAAYTFKFKISNNSDKDIYIGSKSDNSIKVNLVKGTGVLAVTLVTAIPQKIEGDTSLVYIIPKNGSREFALSGRVDNTKGEKGIQSLRINEITYSLKPSLEPLLKLSTEDIPLFGLEFSLDKI